MSALKLLNDKPAGLETDALQLKPYLDTLETLVLEQSELWRAGFVVGLFGPPGSGKSSLLRMLTERLKHLEDDNWLFVRFSLWDYMLLQEPLPGLLQAMAGQQPALSRQIQDLIERDWEQDREARIPEQRLAHLTEDMQQIINDLLQAGKQLIVMIDDVDHCYDSAKILSLFEQIKLLLAGKPYLLFICADQVNLSQLLDIQLNGKGQVYLDKLVQLPLELPPYQARQMLSMFNLKQAETAVQLYFTRITELFRHNPRALKRLWNQAVFGLEVVKNELTRVRGFRHEPSLILMLKWLLLKNCGILKHNPYHYLRFENAALKQESTNSKTLRDEFLQELGFQSALDAVPQYSSFERRLAIFLWQDLGRHCFLSPQVFSLYAHSSREDRSHSRLFIEEQRFMGRLQIEYQDFSWVSLSGGYFSDMHFIACDFSFANLQEALLNNVTFERCQFRGVCFDHSQLEGSYWLDCAGLDELDTELRSYEQIADRLVATWREQPQSQSDLSALYKLYKIIINRCSPLRERDRQRLLDKGQAIRKQVYINFVEQDKES